MNREHDDATRTRAPLALRRLSSASVLLWLVRPDLGQAATPLGFVLLHHLPGVVDALGAAVHRHG